jgi:purine-binding chemotaxis protein CheW
LAPVEKLKQSDFMAGGRILPAMFPHKELFMATMTENSATLENTLSETHGTLQLVSFHLDKEVYGIEITKVREIILITEITRIPQTPHYVKGLINLRSTVIPVIDLRSFFGLHEGDLTDESRIMVLQACGKTIGIVVDAVSEVLRIKRDEIASPPPTVAGLGREYLTGLVRLEKQLLILLDIDNILGKNGDEVMDAVAAAY